MIDPPDGKRQIIAGAADDLSVRNESEIIAGSSPALEIGVFRKNLISDPRQLISFMSG